MFRGCVTVKRLLSSSTAPVKPFSEIPGPKSYPFIGSAWKYFPIVGDYDVNRLHLIGLKKFEEYGCIVKEEAPPDKHIVNVFDPNDIERVYKAEGKHPSRSSHSVIDHYRMSRPHLYNNGGIITTNGPEWWHLRSVFQKPLARLKNVRQFLPTTDRILADFLSSYVKPGETVPDFQQLVARLGLEATWVMIFGERLDRFRDVKETGTTVQKLMEGATGITNYLLRLNNTEFIWKKWKTPTYRKVERYLETVESIVLDKLNERKRQINGLKGSQCLVGEYLQSPEVDFKDVTGITIDLILGSVDTTSYQLCFAVWHLSNHPRVQDRLREEANRLLPAESSVIDSEILNQASYTRAVLKEVFRLNPISIGISRILAEDAILSGYFVPKGTIVVTQNMAACRQAKYFLEPTSFKPERWLKEATASSDDSRSSPYLILPFSHGSRTCIARRFAEQNLLSFLLKVSREYKITWMGDDLNIESPLILRPDRPIQLKFER